MTIPAIITNAKICQYLSSLAIIKKGLVGGGIPAYLPTLIRQVRIAVEEKYNENPSDSSLTATSNYLYTLCSKFRFQAQAVTGGGGSVAPAVPSSFTAIPDFIVDANSFIKIDDTSVFIPSYRGFDLLFSRGQILQSTINLGGGFSYYTWNKTTTVLTFFPEAVAGELIQLRAAI